MILYADVYILINVFCNWLAFFTCGKMLSLKIRPVRLIIGVVILSMYGFISIFLRVNAVTAVFFHMAALCAGCIAVYGLPSAVQLFKTIIVFFVSCVFIGGVAGWLYGLAGGKMIIALLLTPVIYGIWLLVFEKTMTDVHKKSVSVEIDGVRLKGLADSGNLLIDPRSGLPVIVISPTAGFSFADKECFETEVSTAAGNDILMCFKPCSVTVGKREVCAVAAVSANNFEEYDCIVPVKLI